MSNTCIFTVVDDNYLPFSPLFKYCVKKSYTEYDCLVYPSGPTKPFYASALRFLICEKALSEYENVLITDADILIRRETPELVVQHRNHMKFNNLKCYDNCDHGDHMPGVHFVTKEWWDVTRPAREKYLKLIESKELREGDDEMMLRNIVSESKLTICKHPIMWEIHGLHLGRFRNKNINAIRFQPNDFEFVDSLLGDDDFMGLVEKARAESPIVENVFKSVMAVYKKRRKE